MESVRTEVKGRINWAEFKAKLAENAGSCYELDFGEDTKKAKSTYVYLKRLLRETGHLAFLRGAKVFVRA